MHKIVRNKMKETIVCNNCGHKEHDLALSNFTVELTIDEEANAILWLVHGKIKATMICNECELKTNIKLKDQAIELHDRIISENCKELLDIVEQMNQQNALLNKGKMLT